MKTSSHKKKNKVDNTRYLVAYRRRNSWDHGDHDLGPFLGGLGDFSLGREGDSLKFVEN